MDNFTFEEQNLMCIYNTGTRRGLMTELETMMGHLAPDETELRAMADSALIKLRGISDADFAALDLFPDFEGEGENE